MNLLTGIEACAVDTCATIGFFDGVHLGHRYLLDALKERAAEARLQTLLVSFADSPLRALAPETPLRLLSTPTEKVGLLTQCGIDNCLLLDFDGRLAALTAAAFLRMLRDRFRVRMLLVGYDHHFGSDCAAFDQIADAGATLGIDVVPCGAAFGAGAGVKSSRIRESLIAGDVERANAMLGYRYMLTGLVVSGEQIGRRIGFPTANLSVAANKLLPQNGVYAVETEVDSVVYRGMLNIGLRPTVAGHEPTVEVHLIGFSGDLYGRSLQVRLLRRIRDERPFLSLDALAEQLRRDRDVILSF